MGNESDLHMAIRTIAVSARVAIASSRRAGRPDVAAECARRGLTMLDALRDRFEEDPPESIRQLFDAAVRELTAVADASPGEVGSAATQRDAARASAGEG